MDTIILDSFAKLNLYLAVIRKRKDNFHDIKTVFERISLTDKVILTCRTDNKIKIICRNPTVPKDHTNLAYRSAELLRDNYGIKKGLNIEIIKNIPVGAGLGGGSSNAASVLAGLNKLWKLRLSIDRIAKLAQRIGSDVPFFVYNCSFAQASGRGDRIKPLKALNRVKLWHILAVPRLKVSTPLIYEKYDYFAKTAKSKKKGKNVWLTNPVGDVKILTLALEKNDINSAAGAMFNDLEAVTSRLYPEVLDVKEKFNRLGLKAILMSGSGPAVFGVVSSRKEAVYFCNQLRTQNKLWRVFVSKTV